MPAERLAEPGRTRPWPGPTRAVSGCARIRLAAPLKLRFREYNSGGTLLATSPLSQVTLSTSWQQVTVTYTVTTVGSNLDFNAFLASADAPPGNCFYADDASVLR